MSRILIIDDDVFIRNSLARCFADMDHETLTAGSLGEGIPLAEAGVDVIYLDLDLPDGDGQKAIETLAATRAHPEIIVITGLGDNYGAKETLACGAWDYIPKPASPHAIKASLQSALNYRREHRSGPAKPAFDACGIIGDALSLQRAKGLIARAAESDASVLILGETGVGKGLAARAIHANSRRKDRPFIVVDCSNLTESLVESVLYGHVKGSFTGAHADRKGLVAEADGGTLFLDEVGELPLALQKSFLRVLQEHRFRAVGSSKEQTSDFRLVTATNRDLEAMTRNGKFRSDLLFRLHTVEVRLPALRDRSGDVAKLAEHFTNATCNRYALPPKTLSPQLMTVLAGHTWPGNIRELGNVLEATVIEAGQDAMLYPKHLPSHIRVSFLSKGNKKAGATAPQAARRDANTGTIQSYEAYKASCDRAYFEKIMDACAYDVSKASRLSGLSVPSIYRHLGLAGIPTRKRTGKRTDQASSD
ncbi:MAG: sigma-54-dependent transcriptional regulator [Solidesulfovibrio sp.]